MHRGCLCGADRVGDPIRPEEHEANACYRCGGMLWDPADAIAHIRDLEKRVADFEAGGQRLYCCLARFDRRDGSQLADIVQAAREGWERSHPDMAEDDAWLAYDRLSDDAPIGAKEGSE